MADEYTPTTEEIREYVEIGGEPRPWLPPTPDEDAARRAAFDRWLAAHDAEVARAAAEKALREAAGYCTSENWTGPAATLVHLNHWLTTRADRLAGGESRG